MSMINNVINRYENPWQGFKYVNGTLEEWVKKSPAEIDAIEVEIREIRGLLDEATNDSTDQS